MTPPLQYSVYDDNAEPKNIKKNKTYKRKPTKKVKNFLQAMDSSQTMEDYEPKPKATPSSYPAYPQKPHPIAKKKNNESADTTDTPIENFTQLPSITTGNEYYKHYVPYYTNVENSSQLAGSRRSELMEKLNYMIHLLEEQQETKTSNVAEELILYLFLGVFVIFVVDSFARAGKYKR